MRWINSKALERFDPVEWDAIAARVAESTAPHAPFMADVVTSIRSHAQERLAGFLSMHDLAVTTAPVPVSGPIEVVWVRPQLYGSEDTDVLVEHWSATGHDDRIVRPGVEAVRLFWRFAIEKFGIAPGGTTD